MGCSDSKPVLPEGSSQQPTSQKVIDSHASRYMSPATPPSEGAADPSSSSPIQPIRQPKYDEPDTAATATDPNQDAAEQEAAAVRIQASARQRAAKKRVEGLKAEKNAGAGASEPTAAPAAPTDASASPEDRAEQEAAAVRIQASARQRAAKKRVADVREQKEQEAAAVRIQASARQRAAKKRVDELKAGKGSAATAAPSPLDPAVGPAALFYCGRKLPEVGYVMVSFAQPNPDDYKLSTYDPNTSISLNAMFPVATVEALASAHDPTVLANPQALGNYICKHHLTVTDGAIQLTDAPFGR